jgi:hypothetical protein
MTSWRARSGRPYTGALLTQLNETCKQRSSCTCMGWTTNMCPRLQPHSMSGGLWRGTRLSGNGCSALASTRS